MLAGFNDSVFKVAQAYFDAMAAKDVAGIMKLVSQDITCSSPLGALAGASAFRGFQDGFARMTERLTLVAALADDGDAMLVYVANTKPVAEAYVAEHLTVRDGKIVALRVIYDSAPFADYAASVQPH